MRAMHRILNYEEPGDWTVATGESRTIRDMCKVTFDLLGMNYEDHVTVDSKYFRPHELNFLKGDSSEIREVLGGSLSILSKAWYPKWLTVGWGLFDEHLCYYIKQLCRTRHTIQHPL